MAQITCCISCLTQDEILFDAKDLMTTFTELINTKLPFIFNSLVAAKFCKRCHEQIETFQKFKSRCLTSISSLEQILWECGNRGSSYDVSEELRKVVKLEPHEDTELIQPELIQPEDQQNPPQPFEDFLISEDDDEPNYKIEADEIESDHLNQDDYTADDNDFDDEPIDFEDSKIQIRPIEDETSEPVPWNEFNKRIINEHPPVQRVKKNEKVLQQLDMQCEMCDVSTPDLISHIKAVHVTQSHRTLSCFVCEEKFRVFPGLDHFDQHRVFKNQRLCQYCDASFNNVFDLKRHFRAHFNEGSGVMCSCGEEFPSQKTRDVHIAEKHMNQFVCKFCFLVFSDSTVRDSHSLTHSSQKRKYKKKGRIDDELTDPSYTANKSTNRKRPYKTRVIFCSICNEHVVDISNHIVNAHFTVTEDKKYSCSLCGVKSGTIISARAHINNIHRSFEKPCPVCGEVFIKNIEFRKHLNDHHTPSRQYECDYCKTTYTQKGSLRYHMIATHSSNNICKYCMREFNDKEIFDAHIKEELEKRTNSVHVCDICGFETRHKRYMKDHVARRHGAQTASVSCDECGKWFKSFMNLKDHKLNKHREKTISCEICGKKTRNNALMKEHVKAAHPTQQVSCEICGKLVNPIFLKRHRLLAHSAVRPHSCKVCNMSFKTKGVLLKHLHSHSGTRPFNCNQCGQGYYTRGLLSKHYTQAHNLNYSENELRDLAKRMPSSLEVQENSRDET